MLTQFLKKSLRSFSISRLLCLNTYKAVQIGVGLVLLWWIVDWFSIDEKRLVQAFAQASFTLLALAMICFALSIVVKSRQCLLLFSRSMSTAYMTGVILSQNALLTFLPWRLGEISFPVLLRRDQNIPIADSISSLIAIRCLDLSVVVIVALIGGIKLGFQMSLTNLGLAIGAAIVLVVVLELAFRRLRDQSLLEVGLVAVKPLGNPWRLGNLLFLAVGIFCLSTLQSTFTLQSFGLSVSLYDIALLNALTLLAALIPIHPPGGWGTIDSIQIAILHYLNYQPEDSAPVILAAHCFYTVLISLGGMLGWILRGKSLSR